MLSARDVRRLLRSTSLGLAWALAAGGCSRPPPPQPVRVGIILAVASEDEWHLAGTARLALARAAEAASPAVRPVELVVADSGDTVEGALAAARKLINRDAVVAIVGPYDTREAVPVARLAEQAGVPMVSPGSTSPETTAGKRCVFRACFTDQVQGRALARFARRRLGRSTAAVLYDAAQEYSRSLATIFRDAFEAEGGRVLAFEGGTTDQQDFGDALRRIRRARPEVLFLPGEPTPVERQVLQARALGIDATLLGSDGWNYAGFARRPEFEGAYAASHWEPGDQSPASRAFVEAYRAAYGAPPAEVQALTWDAVNLLLAAIGRAGEPLPSAVCASLREPGTHEGATGLIRSGTAGDPEKSVVILRFASGRAARVDRVDPD